MKALVVIIFLSQNILAMTEKTNDEQRPKSPPVTIPKLNLPEKVSPRDHLNSPTDHEPEPLDRIRQNSARNLEKDVLVELERTEDLDEKRKLLAFLEAAKTPRGRTREEVEAERKRLIARLEEASSAGDLKNLEEQATEQQEGNE